MLPAFVTDNSSVPRIPAAKLNMVEVLGAVLVWNHMQMVDACGRMNAGSAKYWPLIRSDESLDDEAVWVKRTPLLPVYGPLGSAAGAVGETVRGPVTPDTSLARLSGLKG